LKPLFINSFKKINNMKKKLMILALLVIVLYAMPVKAQEVSTCAVYFTGVGCPHCAKTDPVIVDLVKQHPNLVIIEYEIYQEKDNAYLLLEYNNVYNSGLGVPLIIFGKDNYIIGDTPILNNINEKIGKNNPCPLINGSSIDFYDLDINTLPGKPKIWINDRILIKTGEKTDNTTTLKNLLTTNNIPSSVKNVNYSIIEPEPVALSGKYIYFNNAIKTEGFIFEWNGDSLENQNAGDIQQHIIDQSADNADTLHDIENGSSNEEDIESTELTLPKLVSLALVDAVNPCALAVLTLMLIAILTYNPTKKRNVLFAGFAFTVAVFIMYFFYGLVIIKFFQIVQMLTNVRLWLYKILGVIAVILGLLNIKDFVKYKPGGFATEMPMSLRPKVKKIISGITSPRGAFGIGIFVTLFLLPCTIGPYVIAGGILSAYEIIKTFPPLLLYNMIFVAPMIAITLIVYSGFRKVEDVSGWKEKNIRHLHLIAGIIMLCLGVGMFLGWI